MKNSINKTLNERKRGDIRFYLLLLAFPAIQYVIFYIYVNIDSFVLMFQSYNPLRGTYNFGTPLANFDRFFQEIASSSEVGMGLLRNVINYAVSLCVNVPFVVYLSYVIYKKIPGHKFFKIALYAPTVVSGTVWVVLYTQIAETAIPELWMVIFGQEIKGLLSNDNLTYVMLLYFSIWSAAGGGTLLYISVMSGIPDEQVDAMKIDGASAFTEFRKLTLPYMWPIFSMFLYTGVSAILTSDFGLYTFYGESAPTGVRTYGYWVAIRKIRASSNVIDLPYIAAIGMIQSAITIPLMFFVKHLLSKVGPSTD